MIESALTLITTFSQELTLGFFLLMFITGVSIKMSNGKVRIPVSKQEWQRNKRLY